MENRFKVRGMDWMTLSSASIFVPNHHVVHGYLGILGANCTLVTIVNVHRSRVLILYWRTYNHIIKAIHVDV